jgi:hypothetical protein
MSNADDGPADRGFSHTPPTDPDAGDTRSSTTRYLSGAAYIDERYAQLAVDELVAQSHRAVVPTLGYDATTVLRHCFRAQRLWLEQNGLVCVVLILGLCVLPGATMTVYGICLVTRSLRAMWRAGRLPRWGNALAAMAGIVFLTYLLALLGVLDSLRDIWPDDSDTGELSGNGGAAAFLGGVLAISVALFATLTWSRYRMITAIVTWLGRSPDSAPARTESPSVEKRLAVIDRAQHGNIVLGGGSDPFVGAGSVLRAWSVATELHPEKDADAASVHVPIDPVELVGHVRRRLAAMRSHDLPEPERIIGLQLRDQVVASAVRWHDSPLIDDRSRLPYSYADPDAVDAIIRWPQTGARHFLRAVVGAPNKAATDTTGRRIMPAEHQSVVTSTFLHVAVEGGMLYVESVATVLGPIRQEYLDVDRYAGSGDQLPAALREAVRRFARTTVSAPRQLARHLLRQFALARTMHRADLEAAADQAYDFGARFDVREAAVFQDYANYLQLLDITKYTRMIERRATEAIHDFLTAKGVETSDFTNRVRINQNNNTVIHGSVHGPVATGTGASATVVTGKPKGSGT